jgi:hypothetical protein
MGFPAMRFVVLVAALLACASCGILTEADEDQKVAMATAQVIKGVSRCNANYAAGFAKSAVARTDCINDALTLMRPLYPYPDLLDLYLANRRAIAEKFGSGKIALAKANEEFYEQRSKMIDEEQRRLPQGKSETAISGVKPRHGTLFDTVFKGAVTCRPNDTSVNCL